MKNPFSISSKTIASTTPLTTITNNSIVGSTISHSGILPILPNLGTTSYYSSPHHMYTLTFCRIHNNYLPITFFTQEQIYSTCTCLSNTLRNSILVDEL